MEIRKWMIILVATAVLGKLFALGLTKIHVLPQMAELEKRTQQKLAQIFTSDSKPIMDEKPAPLVTHKPITKTAFKKPLPPLPFKVFNPVVEKKAKLETVQEEKDRRKKRKKKLEKEADKKKQETTVTVLKDDQKIKAKTEEPLSLVYATEPAKKEERADEAPAPIKPRVDLAAWIKLLNSQPVAANLKSFVSIYKSGQITSADYYAVMGTLQKSPNKDVRKLAILGSSIEANVVAYSILVHEKYSETVVELQTLANSSLQIYKNSKYLAFLMQPLTTGDVFVKIESSDTIGAIAQSFKTSPTPLTADVRSALNRSVAILTPLTKDASSKELQASATQTLKFVKDILGLTT